MVPFDRVVQADVRVGPDQDDGPLQDLLPRRPPRQSPWLVQEAPSASQDVSGLENLLYILQIGDKSYIVKKTFLQFNCKYNSLLTNLTFNSYLHTETSPMLPRAWPLQSRLSRALLPDRRRPSVVGVQRLKRWLWHRGS